MAQKKDGGGGFGRDEMNALLGGDGLREALLRPPTSTSTSTSSGTLSKTGGKKKKDKDVADMTTEETL